MLLLKFLNHSLSFLVLTDGSNNDLGSVLRSLNLDERVLVAESFLTDFAVVEVVADAALVPDTYQWMGSTPITSNSFVDHQVV